MVICARWNLVCLRASPISISGSRLSFLGGGVTFGRTNPGISSVQRDHRHHYRRLYYDRIFRGAVREAVEVMACKGHPRNGDDAEGGWRRNVSDNPIIQRNFINGVPSLSGVESACKRMMVKTRDMEKRTMRKPPMIGFRAVVDAKAAITYSTHGGIGSRRWLDDGQLQLYSAGGLCPLRLYADGFRSLYTKRVSRIRIDVCLIGISEKKNFFCMFIMRVKWGKQLHYTSYIFFFLNPQWLDIKFTLTRTWLDLHQRLPRE